MRHKRTLTGDGVRLDIYGRGWGSMMPPISGACVRSQFNQLRKGEAPFNGWGPNMLVVLGGSIHVLAEATEIPIDENNRIVVPANSIRLLGSGNSRRLTVIAGTRAHELLWPRLPEKAKTQGFAGGRTSII